MTSENIRKPININNSEPIIFQSIDWFDCDYATPYLKDELSEFRLNRNHNKSFTIFAFGVSKDGNSVCCRIKNFKPYFYIRIPEEFTDVEIEKMKSYFNENYAIEQDKIPYEYIDDDIKFESKYYKSGICDNVEIVEKEIFWKFMNKKKFKFLKIYFHSKESLKFFYQYLKNPVNLGNNKKDKYNLFEADFEPLLRFYHEKKIEPSGWCKVNKFNLESNQSKCQINISCDWLDIIKYDSSDISPLRIAAFDIEADSSHGDFPIANKDCQKLANQLTITWIRDVLILKKDNKNSSTYIEALKRTSEKHEFFKKRIKQSLLHDPAYHIDDEIDYLYLKSYRMKNYFENMDKKLSTSKFNTLSRQIYEIIYKFDPTLKIKANNELKGVIKSIKVAEENYLKKYNDISWDNLMSIIDTVADKNKDIAKINIIKKYINKDVMVRYINRLLNKFLGNVEGDRIIQIGTVFWTYGENECFHNNIITLRGCNEFNVGDTAKCEVISYDYKEKTQVDNAEKKILLRWTKLIEEYDPDIIIGYNTFGFDMAFMYDRAVDLFNYDESKKYDYTYHNNDFVKFINMGRLDNNIIKYCSSSSGKLINKKLSSSALGDNFLYYFNMPGRVQIDLLKVCQSSMVKLPSYKLDDVASFYISGDIIGFGEEHKPGYSKFIKVKSINEIDDGNFIVITMTTTGQQLYDGNKLVIKNIDRDNNILELEKEVPTNCLPNYPKWGLAKDDVSPKDIFRLQNGNDADRSIVAKYCIQDCVLLIRLLKKLEVIPNNIGMSNVSLIPFSYIFLRGQGIKIFSLIVNECSERGFVLPTLDKVIPDEEEINDFKNYINSSKKTYKGYDVNYEEKENTKYENKGFTLSNDFNVIEMTEESYEGAIVLKPKPNIYFEPIAVLDFGSLYPSEMIASDLSHDRIVEDDIWLGEEGKKRLFELGYDVIDRSYDNYAWIDPKKKNKGKKKIGICNVRFVQPHNGEKGLIPQVLMKLLGARKATKKKLKQEKDPFKRSILDGLQLAYKLTANSLYGQIGAKTSKIYKKEIAASTTAGGRENIYTARDFCLDNNPGCEVVYGDSIPKWEYITVYDSDYNKYTDTVENIINYFCNVNNSEIFNDINNINKSKIYYYPEQLIYTKTAIGYTKIKVFMEHYTNHELYRITLNSSANVTVTSDHSLILDNGRIIKPTELKKGDKLLTFYDKSYDIKDGNCVKDIINLGYYNDRVYDLTTDNHQFNAGIGNIVVHNTDSVFVKLKLDYSLPPVDKESLERIGKEPITKLDKIKRSIEISEWLQQKLKDDKVFRPPHDLEYEKVYYPLILITKKRYIGIKYEFNPEEGKKTSMGVVTKRRDNAPILKHIFIGVVDTLMKECDLYKAIKFVRDACLNMINDNFDLNMYVISKTLKEYYKDPESIAHKVLAMRMAERDPGNKPASNERLPYVYIKIDEEPGVEYLQGDRIEHINYVRENNLQVDYEVYIKNQIMKPVSQIFELVVEQLPGFPYPNLGKQYFYDMEYKYYEKYEGDIIKLEKKMREEKSAMVQKLIFMDLIQKAIQKINKINTLDKYFNNKNISDKINDEINDKIKEDKNNKDNNINNIFNNNEQIKKKKNKKQLKLTNLFS